MRSLWVDWTAGVIRIPTKEEAAHRERSSRQLTILAWIGSPVMCSSEGFSQPKGVRTGPAFANLYKDGGIIPYDSAREAIARAIRKAGVKPGTLDHFAGIPMPGSPLSKSKPANVVQSQLGHTTASTTQIYTHLNSRRCGQGVRGLRDRRRQPSRPRPAPCLNCASEGHSPVAFQ